MTREIKFRCITKRNTWVYFTLNELLVFGPTMIDIGYNNLTDDSGVECDDFNLDNTQQYTGLKDKNGIEIYEGDIIKSDLGINVGYAEYIPVYNREVVYNDKSASFCINTGGSLLPISLIISDIEVIGNIYQDKELLK